MVTRIIAVFMIGAIGGMLSLLTVNDRPDGDKHFMHMF